MSAASGPVQGPLRSLGGLIQRGSVGPLWAGDLEIVRRIFVTVRDRAWREIAPSEWRVSLDAANPRSAHLKTRHIADGVDFSWEGVFTASQDLSTFSFRFQGEALGDMEVCRVGLVILHPVDFMVGADLTVASSTATERMCVQPEIYPQAIVNGLPTGMTEPFSELTVERADGTRLELRFEGDLFEMEDQRNWADTSFKTYCTPLRLGFPRRLPAGARIAQRLEGSFTCARPEVVRLKGRDPETAPVPVHEGRFPAIGRMESDSTLPGASDRRLKWNHIHTPVNGPAAPDRIAAACEAGVGVGIELSVDLAGEPVPWARYRDDMGQRLSSAVHLVAYGAGVAPPSASAIARLQQELSDAGLTLPILAGTRGFFVELNRGIEQKASVDGVAFPLNHTVHGSDEVTISENVPSVTDLAATARRRWHTPNVAVVPLALFYPGGGSERFPRELVRPWLAATLIEAALAGVETITLSNDLLETLNLPEDDTISEVLSPLLEFRGRSVRRVSSESSDDVHALVLEDASRSSRYLLAANLGSGAASVTIGDARSRSTLEVSARGVLLAKLA